MLKVPLLLSDEERHRLNVVLIFRLRKLGKRKLEIEFFFLGILLNLPNRQSSVHRPLPRDLATFAVPGVCTRGKRLLERLADSRNAIKTGKRGLTFREISLLLSLSLSCKSGSPHLFQEERLPFFPSRFPNYRPLFPVCFGKVGKVK